MKKKELHTIGWREELVIPEFSRHKIKAKIDTGARTSALHVTDLKITQRGRFEYANFKIHPNQDSSKPAIRCKKKIIEKRRVKSSNGMVSLRPVIDVEIRIGDLSFETEVTLVNRDLMGFRMLLGRKALKKRFLVDVQKSFVFRKRKKGAKK